MDKDRIPVWSKENFKVESINESMGQDFQKLEGRPRELMRSEICLGNENNTTIERKKCIIYWSSPFIINNKIHDHLN